VGAPEEDEVWRGGFISADGGSSTRIREFVKSTLDGVFFADGGFAGPNQLGSWSTLPLRRKRFKLARSWPLPFRRKPPDPAATRKEEFWHVGRSVLWMRKAMGDEKAMASIAGWAHVKAPKLHKL
jgi:hypothetical protein